MKNIFLNIDRSAPFMSPGQERTQWYKDREEMPQADAVRANSLATSRTV